MRIAFLAVLLSWCTLALAADPNCPVTLPQEQINECFAKASAETQHRMDGLLRELRTSLTDKNWSLVKESQNFWEKSRSLDCKVEASFIDGPVRNAVAHGCIEKRTRQRMHQLRYFLCPRYDLTGQCDAERMYE